MNRRQFSKGLLAVSASGSLGKIGLLASLTNTAKGAMEPRLRSSLPATFASAAQSKNGDYLAVHNGLQLSKLPQRAHQSIARPKSAELLVIGRRPATQIWVIDRASGQIKDEIHSADAHHFYGHAVFTSDGRYLITTEQNIDTGEGLLGVRDAFTKFDLIRYIPSFGIGPHELKLHEDSDTLIVANGGIKTHPNSGRDKLNLDTMQPSLAYISLKNGQLIEKVNLPDALHKLSIRHIDITNDTCVLAVQDQSDTALPTPLVALHKRGHAIKFLDCSQNWQALMKGYCGSVAIDKSKQFACVTHPRGNLVSIWSLQSKKAIHTFRANDVCGVCSNKEKIFYLSAGSGKLYEYTVGERKAHVIAQTPFAWDNHLNII